MVEVMPVPLMVTCTLSRPDVLPLLVTWPLIVKVGTGVGVTIGVGVGVGVGVGLVVTTDSVKLSAV